MTRYSIRFTKKAVKDIEMLTSRLKEKLKTILQAGRRQAYHAVNSAMIQTYWIMAAGEVTD